MISVKETATSGRHPYLVNRIMYSAFTLMSFYQLFVQNDVADAFSNLGIALIFDPFDPKITWGLRPIYQRAWLIVHVALTFALIGWSLVQ